MDNKVENAEMKTENAEEQLESAGVEPGGAGEISEGEAKKEACTEKKLDEKESESTEEALAQGGKTAAVKASSENVGKKQDGKNKISRKKLAGVVELAAALILAALSAGLFANTRGTRLLYVSVATGRVSRYYWIFLAAAVISLVTGVFTWRSCRGDDKENLLIREKKTGENDERRENDGRKENTEGKENTERPEE